MTWWHWLLGLTLALWLHHRRWTRRRPPADPPWSHRKVGPARRPKSRPRGGWGGASCKQLTRRHAKWWKR